MTGNIPRNIAKEMQQHEQSKSLGPTEKNLYRIWQSNASPYSQKVISFMNYKAIAYKKIQATQQEIEWIKTAVGQSIVPVMMSPAEEVMQDSTPIMALLEARFPEILTIPEDQRLAFIMWLIEDFSDEYMIRMVVHTRWGKEEGQIIGSHRIARTITFGSSNVDTQTLAPVIRKRQMGFDQHLGLSDGVRQNMDQQFEDLLDVLESHFKDYQFLLGFRPSMADFALYGMMLNIYEDGVAGAAIAVKGPRVCRWIETIRDLGDNRGAAGQVEFGNWLDFDKDSFDHLERLLVFISKTYLPIAKAGAKCFTERQKTFEAEVYGQHCTFSNHQYRLWSFEQLQERYEALNEADRSSLDTLLKRTGIQPDMMKDGIVHTKLFDGCTPPIIVDGVADARMRYIRDKQKQ